MAVAVALALVACWSAPARATVASAPSTAGPAVTVRLEPREITVGDRVRVELDVTLPPGSPGPPALPPDLRAWGNAEVLAAGEAQRLPGPGEPRWRIHVLLTAFRPGEVTLPSLPLRTAPPGGDEVARPTPGDDEPALLRTPEGLGFLVRSVLPADAEPTPKPPSPPQPLPLGRAFWWLAGGLLGAVVLATGALLLQLRRQPAATAAAPGLAPLPALLRELAALRAEPSVERAHTGLSLALRHFLAAVLGIAAAEHTTTEIDRELRRGPLEPGTRRGIVELLRRCDEVKFARRPATAEDVASRLDGAAALAAQVERELAPPPPPPPEGRPA